MGTSKPSIAATLAGAAALVGCATNTAPAESSQRQASGDRQQCFLPQNVSDWTPVDDTAVYVTVGVNRIFKLDLAGPCPDVDWTQQIGIQARPAGSWVCGGMDADLIIPGQTVGPRRCPVTNVTMLSPDEVTALRESQRKR